MKISERLKNPWFWVGLGGVILTAMGVNPEMFTSWGAVKEQVLALVGNPFMLVSVLLAVLGVFAVSYTHLDVYKRQSYSSCTSSAGYQ